MVLGAIGGLALGIALGGVASTSPLSNGLNYGLNSLIPNTLLSPNELIDLHHRGGITNTDFYQTMRYWGYDTRIAKAYYYTKDSLLTPEQIASWRISQGLRQLQLTIDEDLTEQEQAANQLELLKIYESLMKEQGYRPLVATNYWEAIRPLPTFSTILDWMAKEVFEPDKIKKFRLAEEEPTQLAPYMSAYNTPPSEASKYWVAHWATIGYGRWDEMYQRFRNDRNTADYSDIDPQELAEAGVTWDQVKISPEDYNDYYTILEYSPYFRDRGRGAVYRPLPFTVLQQLWQYGVLTYRQMVGRLRDYGYSKRSSELILEAWQRKFPYGFREPLRDNIIKRYEKRIITREQAETQLEAAGVSEDAITFLLNDIDDKIQESQIQNQLKALTNKALREVMTDMQINERLDAIFGSGDDTRKAYELEVIKSKSAERAVRVALRLGGKAYGQNRITKTEFTAWLRKRFVSNDDIEIAIKAYEETPAPNTGSST